MKTVIVTGASKGIGAATCRSLRAKGVRVIGVARSKELLEVLSMEKIGIGPMEFVAGNITDPKTVIETIDLATRDGQSLDALILNAGSLGPVEMVEQVNIDEVRQAFDVNLFSNINWIQTALPALRKSKGRIILTSSGTAHVPYSGFAAYCTSKAALNVLTSVLAKEEQDITVLAVEPGIVETEMYRDFWEKGSRFMSTEQSKYLEGLRENGIIAKPEDVSGVYAQLALMAPSNKSGNVVKWNDPWINKLQL